MVNDVILLNDLYKRKHAHSLNLLYTLNLPLRPRQGPFQHPLPKRPFEDNI